MHLPQLVPALRGVRQRLLPNGRFAAAVWSAPSRVPTLSLPRTIISQYIAVPAPPAGTPGPFSLSESGALEQAFTQAGWSGVGSESLELILELDSAADYVQFMQAVSPSIHALLASQSIEQQERIWQAIRETVQKRYGHADGTVRIPGEAICLVARC